MAKKTNYSVTIGYRAVITVGVKAENEKQAKEIAIAVFKDARKFPKCQLEDDNFKADGVVDMDATWNMYDK